MVKILACIALNPQNDSPTSSWTLQVINLMATRLGNLSSFQSTTAEAKRVDHEGKSLSPSGSFRFEGLCQYLYCGTDWNLQGSGTDRGLCWNRPYSRIILFAGRFRGGCSLFYLKLRFRPYSDTDWIVRFRYLCLSDTCGTIRHNTVRSCACTAIQILWDSGGFGRILENDGCGSRTMHDAM